MAAKRLASTARTVGRTLAGVQHTLDRLTQWGFKTMRKVGADTEKSESPPAKTPLQKAAKAGRGVLSFLGQAGDAFYEHYEELKTKKSQ